MAIPRRTVRQVIIEETKKFLAVAAYLWAIFALLVEYKSVILSEANVSIETRGLALINALALGKIIVIAEAFHLGEMAEDVPLIYPTVLKSALFSILLAGFKILEVGIVGLFHHRPFAESITEIGGGTLKGIICVTLIMFVVLVPFFAYGEVRRVLGQDRLRQLFFQQRTVEAK